ncbi:MAG: hypothetical protein AAGC60_00095 [Acidobacteriota bacterium]
MNAAAAEIRRRVACLSEREIAAVEAWLKTADDDFVELVEEWTMRTAREVVGRYIRSHSTAR